MTETPRRRRVALTLVAFAFAVVAALRRCRVDDVPLSPLVASGRVGPDWPERTGVAAEESSPPVGEMDDMAVYARPEFDPERVAPAVRRFYERTSEYGVRFRVRWHRGFRLGARLVSPLTAYLEQLNLPGRSGETRRLTSRFRRIRPSADPRTDARAWIRTDESGAAVFVAVYARHTHDGETFTNIAVPLPFCNLSTVLRWHHRGDGVALSTRGEGHPGLYLRTPFGAFELPMGQRFEVQPSDCGALAEGEWDGTGTLRARHEMWVVGRQFLTLDYTISR